MLSKGPDQLEAEPSIFERYYSDQPFVDRFEQDAAEAVDVIIPVIHTNELWHANLLSIYREVPVKRLILGDGGCIDGSLDVACRFPRVEVLDHRSFTSLGYSIRFLIEAVRTEWFIYLHSDVYLPEGWFEAMCRHRRDYDWFECDQRITILADYRLDLPNSLRPFSGSQMGRKAAFANVTSQIDDDYLYRNEDIIIAGLVAREGYRYGKARDTFHFHQVMHKPSRWRRPVKRVDVILDVAREEDVRANSTYARGIIKYLNPNELTPDVVGSLRYAVTRLEELGDTTIEEFREWTNQTNPAWLPYVGTKPSARREWIADRVAAAANMYRVNGAWWTMTYAIRRSWQRLWAKSQAS